MAKHADKIVSLAELRFKPANSNDAARAAFAHHFVNVPRCSFARDDGISQYLGSETGMDSYPASPDAGAPKDVDVPPVQGDVPEAGGRLRRRLLRGGFALSIVLHAAAAIAIGYATLTPPDDAPMEEGTVSITFVVEGNADADANAAGAEEDVKEPETDAKPVEKEQIEPVEKVAEKQPEPIKQPEIVEPAPETTENILKDVPMPVLGADVPEILSTRIETEVQVEAATKPAPMLEKIEPKIEKPVPAVVAEKPVEKKKDDKPEKRRRQNKGNQGDAANNANRGDVDSDNKGKASTNSRGDTSNRETGNAARSNYRGLVNRKLSRAKGRIQAPAKGKVTVTFTIMASGAVSGLRISGSSGKAALDAAALKVVRSASPFPPIPAETGKKSWLMSVPMTFK